MTSKNDQIKNIENEKQGKNYLSHIYSEERRPISNYPLELAKLIIKRNHIKTNANLLDAGCGKGDLLKAFKKNNLNVEGVDLSEESVKFLSPIKVYQKNLEREIIEERENYYDIIFSKSLIEHLNSPLKFIRNCKSLLKDNGCLVIMTPSWYHHKFGPFYLDFTHVTPFTLQSLRDIALLNDYKIISVDYFYQLPIIWKFKFVSLISRLVSFLKIPYYPMYENLTILKWTKNVNTFLRHSNEVMLIGIFKK